MPLRRVRGDLRRDPRGVEFWGGSVKNFAYLRPETVEGAIGLIARNANAKFLGGGTNLVDLMRENIEQPDAVIDVTHLSEGGIDELPDGGLLIHASVRNS